jgi:hypothetical protein
MAFARMTVDKNEAVYRISSKELESSHEAARDRFESVIFRAVIFFF